MLSTRYLHKTRPHFWVLQIIGLNIDRALYCHDNNLTVDTSSSIALCSALKARLVLLVPLSEVDPDVFDLIRLEKRRQRDSICLIPSENFTSSSVMGALGSILAKQVLEDILVLVIMSLSGAPANLYVYSALMKPHERLMGLDLPHVTNINILMTKFVTWIPNSCQKDIRCFHHFETLPYRLNEETGVVDFDALEKTAILYRPKIIIAGASAYPRNWDYARMRKISDSVDAYLMSDMAHISGIVAAGVLPSPFEHSDIVTTTTHKSLRGPRGAMIFFRKGIRSVDKKAKGQVQLGRSNQFFSLSWSPRRSPQPHYHCTCCRFETELLQNSKEYQAQVLKNCKILEELRISAVHSMVSGGTDSHLLLIDLRSKKTDGAQVERILELVNIASNKNTIPGDKSALVPHGLRIGSPAMTTRGLVEADFANIAELIDRAVKITVDMQHHSRYT
ncbi:hypothetical protein BSLG_006064 [Batrachochytrium salamandrivorans]|nr:hypothetical protein BSLG_006064 [Batrachochytrium salamandrivorans]